jgi:hypothetical protein
MDNKYVKRLISKFVLEKGARDPYAQQKLKEIMDNMAHPKNLIEIITQIYQDGHEEGMLDAGGKDE